MFSFLGTRFVYIEGFMQLCLYFCNTLKPARHVATIKFNNWKSGETGLSKKHNQYFYVMIYFISQMMPCSRIKTYYKKYYGMIIADKMYFFQKDGSLERMDLD